MSEFYVLEPIGGIFFGTKWAYAEEVDPVNLGDPERCPVCGNIVTFKRWLPPYRVKLSSSKPEKWGDFLWVGGTSLAVSTRFKSAYENEKLTGIESFSEPLEIVRAGTRRTGDFIVSPPTYHVLSVPWGGANLDFAASNVTYVRSNNIRCSYCRVGGEGRKQDRIAIEKGSWNRKDIFKPRGGLALSMVTRTFKDFVDDYQITNVWLIPADKYGYDAYRAGKFFVKE